MLTILLPYAIFFYETDPEKSYCRRFVTAFLYLLATLVISCALLFASWSFLKFVDLPVYLIQSQATDITDDAQGDISITQTVIHSIMLGSWFDLDYDLLIRCLRHGYHVIHGLDSAHSVRRGWTLWTSNWPNQPVSPTTTCSMLCSDESYQVGTSSGSRQSQHNRWRAQRGVSKDQEEFRRSPVDTI